jgi:hypothetical protein
MNTHFWIRLLHWRQNNKSDSFQLEVAPKLAIRRGNGWGYLELFVANRSNRTVWVEEATVILADLNSVAQFEVAPGQARHEIRQNVGPNDTLSLSLNVAIYNAAGRPQGPYSCLVRTDVRYRVFDEWRNAKLDTSQVEMAGLVPVGIHNARWYNKKIKQVSNPVGLVTPEHKD